MSIVPARVDPSLDQATVRQLRTIGVEYLSTHWSSYWQEWQHHIVVTTISGRHRHTLTKNDQGIAALLNQRNGGVIQ